MSDNGKKNILKLKHPNSKDSEKLLQSKSTGFVERRRKQSGGAFSSKKNNLSTSLSDAEKNRRMSALKNSMSFLKKDSDIDLEEKRKQYFKENFLVNKEELKARQDAIKKQEEAKRALEAKDEKKDNSESDKKPKIAKFTSKFEKKKPIAKQFKKPDAKKDDKKEIAQPKKKKKINVPQWEDDDILYDESDLGEIASDVRSIIANKSSIKKKSSKSFASKKQKKDKVPSRSIVIGENGIIASDLAYRMEVDIDTLYKAYIDLSGDKEPDERISPDIAEIIIQEFGHTPVINNVDSMLYDQSEKIDVRPPVVAVMGHVDHGKTSILDKMRNSSVAKDEAGGITQKVSTYTIEKDGKSITFVDTPGHSVFKEMRRCGANFTDIVVLVVAADDGVKEQTIEAIQHAQKSGVAVVVAINKIDKPDINIEKVRRELSEYNIAVESFGGDVLEAQVSAKTGEGLDSLYDAIFLQAEMLNLRANNKARANGVILDAVLEKGKGIVATAIINNGTLKPRDIFVCDKTINKVRLIFNNSNANIKSAPPSSTVLILGFSEMPTIGSTFHVVENEKQAKQVVEMQSLQEEAKEETIPAFNLFNTNNKKEARFIVKAHTVASSDTIASALADMANDDIDIKVIYSGIGDISDTDLSNAHTCNAIILGFSVKVDKKIPDKYKDLKIELYNIIYQLLDDAAKIIKDIIGDKFEERYIGSAKVTHTFDMKDDKGKKFRVAGCIVSENQIITGENIKIRSRRGDKVIIKQDEIRSLEIRRITAKEVKKGEECGIVLKKRNDIEVGDILECFESIKIN